MKKPKIGAKYVADYGDGHTYYFTIIDISPYREPSMKYGVSIKNELGITFAEMTFMGDKDLESMTKMEDKK